MTPLIASSWWLVAFLVGIGILFLWLAKNETVVPSSDNRRIGRLFNFRLFLVMFSLLYISLAHFTVYGALALSIEYDLKAPCENVIANQTTNGSLVTLSYVDSCASLSTSPLSEVYFQLFTWLLYIDVMVLGLGTLVLTFKFIGGAL